MMVGSTRSGKVGVKSNRNPVHLVVRNPDLVRAILEFCDVDRNYWDVWDYSYRVFDYRRSHPLKKMVSVNRLFRELSTKQRLRHMTFENYSRYHPAMAPDEALEELFAYYQGCARSLIFESIQSLCLNLPFLLRPSHSHLHYISVGAYLVSDFKPQVLVDLKDRIIYLRTEAYVDEESQVHIQVLDDELNLGVERWPKGFKVIRYLHLTIKTSDEARYGHIPLNATDDVKVVPLEDILDPKPVQSPPPEPRDSMDEVHICSIMFHHLTDLVLVERFLRYPHLEVLRLHAHEFTIAELRLIIRQANVKSLVLLSRVDPSGRWSGCEFHQILEAFVDSNIHRLELTVPMAIKSLADLSDISSPGYDQVQMAELEAFAKFSPDYPRLPRPPHWLSGVTLLRDAFPGWTWLDRSPGRSRNPHIIMDIQLAPEDHGFVPQM